MHIQYRISQEEYRSASTLASKKRSNWSALEYFWPYLFAIVWISIGFLPGTGDLGDSTGDIYFELGVIPIFLLFLWTRRVRIKQEYKKLHNFRLLHALDVDANGLRLVTTVGVSRTSWQLYVKYAENEQVFILFEEGKHGFTPISKQHLTHIQADELRSLFEAYIPKPGAFQRAPVVVP